MSIEQLVNRAYTSWAHDKGTSWVDNMRAALTEQAETHALELRAYEATVQNLVEALRGVIRVADRATDEFDVAKAAIMNAVGE